MSALERADRLTAGPQAYSFPHCVDWSQIHSRSQEIGQAIFKMDQVQESEMPGMIQFRHEIDIRLGRSLSTRDRAKEAKMDNAGGPDLGLVEAQRLNDRTLVHAGTLPRMGAPIKEQRKTGCGGIA
jgi:hypothetical protein